MKFGLKLWSVNDNYIETAVDLYNKGIFNYIELFVVPGSASYLDKWKALDIPFLLHAPHSLAGFNPAVSGRRSANLALVPELDEYRIALNPRYIIFHSGVDGSIDETIAQFNGIWEQFPEIHSLSLIENKPWIGLTGTTCVGSSPQEIARIQHEAEMRFCFDIGHAFCAASSSGIAPLDLFRDFIRLQPVMYHLSDGDTNAEYDSHMNLGNGNIDIGTVLKQLPEDARITIETDKASQNNLDDFVKDIEYLSYIEIC
jgi:deoxyribonuclease IV